MYQTKMTIENVTFKAYEVLPPLMKFQLINKNAFQKDAYRPQQ